MARSKAGDNQALATLADTIKWDHKAKQEALKTLARRKNVTLTSTQHNEVSENQRKNLKGAEFNWAYVDSQIKGHREAINTDTVANLERVLRSYGGPRS